MSLEDRVEMIERRLGYPMKAKRLKKELENIPDDAVVTYKLYPLNQLIGELRCITLAFSLGPDLHEIPINKEYPGLPT